MLKYMGLFIIGLVLAFDLTGVAWWFLVQYPHWHSAQAEVDWFLLFGLFTIAYMCCVLSLVITLDILREQLQDSRF